MPAGGAEKCGKRPFEGLPCRPHPAGSHASGESHIVEFKLPCPAQIKAVRQLFQQSHIAKRWIHPALDLAPVAGIQPDLFAEVAQGEAFFKNEGFDGFVEHWIPFAAVVGGHHRSQAAEPK